MKTTILSKLIVASVFLVGSAAVAGGGYDKKEKKNIAQVAIDNGNFTTLVAALTCTDLVGAVSDPSAKLTVFAPTDDAFAKASLNKNNVCTKFDKDSLKNILLYHVAGDKLKSKNITNGMKVSMLNKGEVTLKASDGGVYVRTEKGAKSKVIIADVKASNGIIHAVDGVLLP